MKSTCMLGMIIPQVITKIFLSIFMFIGLFQVGVFPFSKHDTCLENAFVQRYNFI